jgi:hypothetical protein
LTCFCVTLHKLYIKKNPGSQSLDAATSPGEFNQLQLNMYKCMLTLHELKGKLDEGLFFELTVGETNDKWYPIPHLELLKDYFFLEGELYDKCELIVSSYKAGIWLTGRPPGKIERQVAAHALTDFEGAEDSAVYFPASLFDWSMVDLIETAKSRMQEQNQSIQTSTIA